MTTLFISDIHLCKKKPDVISGFFNFLRYRAYYADALYILGDLFETWIGDDDPSHLHSEVAMALKALYSNGVPCYFIHGNRDFLLGRNYAKTCNMILLKEQQVIEIAGQRIVMLHGDILCREDVAYQRFRNRVHKSWVKNLFSILPFSVRLRIINYIKTDSMSKKKSKDFSVMNVSIQAIVEILTETKADIMIHGHTHCPDIHKVITAIKSCHRVVLGEWDQEGSAIEISMNGLKLINFPLSH